MTTHCHAFQVKKCTDSTCFYCQQHPLRLQPDQLSSLHFLPLPLLDATKEHYQKFEEVFGKPLSNSDQPSRVATPTEEQKETDKRRKSLLIAGKVRASINCGDCHKLRCIYANTKLSRQEELAVTAAKD